MDPFLGIGASAVAAAQCRANAFIGFELDPEYLKIATQALCQVGKLSDLIL
jgi:hypothetical protein